MNWINNTKFTEAMIMLAHVVEDRAGKKKVVVVDLLVEVLLVVLLLVSIPV